MSNTQTKTGTKQHRKFGLLDQFAYGAGDFGCNMSFALKGSLTIFWTQFMGIDNYVMSALLLLVQVWDAINDPVIGGMVDADRRKYKRNKFLAYIWLGSIGLLVAGALCFVPWRSAPSMVKNILFVAGYILWDAFYTVANVPYGSLLSLITADPIERAKLSTARSIGSMLGSVSCQILLPFLIYDASNNLAGERLFFIALVMGVIGFIAFQFMIRNTEVRVEREVKAGEEIPKFNVVKAIGNFLRNRPAVGATLAPVGQFIGMYGAQTSLQIMFQAYFKNAQISGLVGMISYVGLILYTPIIGKIVNRFGKKGSDYRWLLYQRYRLCPDAGTADHSGRNRPGAVCTLPGDQCDRNGIGSCVAWSLMADAMDYEEWKFGVRNEGTTYAMHSFFRKLHRVSGRPLVWYWLLY